MRKQLLTALLASSIFMLLTASSAYAYDESTGVVDPAHTLPGTCTSCHGREGSEASSSTVAATRKGPHGGYSTGTNKCESCHSIHGAASARALLPQMTIVATCNTCHDGTGGGGVYGVIERRTGQKPSGHRIGEATDGRVVVPGGTTSGNALMAFSGENGGLTCTDCHSPHDASTVDVFVGDRVRSSGDTSPSVATNRLLKQRPTSAETTVTVYGSEWCESCHKGNRAGTMNHPVASADSTKPADYMHVKRLAGYDVTSFEATAGPLGGSNFGYVLPAGADDGTAPICQQCHEDSRAIANDPSNPLTVRSTTEAFVAPVDGMSDGNPTFQNFPHEAVNDKLLIEAGDSLCLNCHSTAPEGDVH